jgi:hypothetical protein
VGIAAGGTIVVVIVIRQMEISGHEAGGNAARAQRRYHEARRGHDNCRCRD